MNILSGHTLPLSLYLINMLVYSILILVVGATRVSAQNCAKLTVGDLGDSDVPSSSGLIPQRLMESDTPPLVQILGFRIVCESASTLRNRFRGASALVNYTLNSALIMSQFDFQCVGTSTWTISDDADSVTTPPDATMDTLLSTNCFICVHPRAGLLIRTDSHCGGMKTL